MAPQSTQNKILTAYHDLGGPTDLPSTPSPPLPTHYRPHCVYPTQPLVLPDLGLHTGSSVCLGSSTWTLPPAFRLLLKCYPCRRPSPPLTAPLVLVPFVFSSLTFIYLFIYNLSPMNENSMMSGALCECNLPGWVLSFLRALTGLAS